MSWLCVYLRMCVHTCTLTEVEDEVSFRQQPEPKSPYRKEFGSMLSIMGSHWNNWPEKQHELTYVLKNIWLILEIVTAKSWKGRRKVIQIPLQNSPANAGDIGSIPGFWRSSEEGTATHSSILAWRIPWMEESGGLQSMGLQRVHGQDWVSKHVKCSKWEMVEN